MSAGIDRILVVDDEFGMREGCRKILQSEGFEVVTAEDGQAGLEKFLEHRNFSVALVDMKMPRMGGIELIEKIRAVDDDIVILVITAYATIDTAVEATKRGAYGYIPKPFTPDEMLIPVRHGLEKRALTMEAKRLRRERENRLLELAFERTKSSAILQCMTDGVIVINHDGQIVLRNEACARIVPGCEALPIPSPLETLALPDLTNLLKTTLDANAGPMIVSREIPMGENTYMVNVSPLDESGGRAAGVVAVLRDITALKKLETAKSMYVSMVAHEVKRPLGVIEGYLNLVLSGLVADPAKQKDVLGRSLERAKMLRILVTELMNLTAIETGHFTIQRTPTDISKVLADAVELCRERAEERGIRLVLDPAAANGFGPVMADKEAVTTVFTNLIDNAVKYNRDQGEVRVGLENTDNFLKVTVADTGIGMTPDELQKVFDEFYRARNKQTAQVPGTGLGLSLVKKLVDLHHGKIAVASAPGEGSTFSVLLPKKEPTECRID